MTIIAPSLLSADFLHLETEIRSVEKSGAQWLHLDIMDGHFVPNITFGPFIVRQIRKMTNLFLDAHLMIDNPAQYIDAFIDAGCNAVTVHAETDYHLHRTLQAIKSRGVSAGVCVNPHTGLDMIPYLSDLLDLVLVMTVNPGFGGQNYIPRAGMKVAELDEMRARIGASFLISVDGGMNRETSQKVIEYGADVIVMGSYFFSTSPENRRNLVDGLTG